MTLARVRCSWWGCTPTGGWFRCGRANAASRSCSSIQSVTSLRTALEIPYPVEAPQDEDFFVRETAGEAFTRLMRTVG